MTTESSVRRGWGPAGGLVAGGFVGLLLAVADGILVRIGNEGTGAVLPFWPVSLGWALVWLVPLGAGVGFLLGIVLGRLRALVPGAGWLLGTAGVAFLFAGYVLRFLTHTGRLAGNPALGVAAGIALGLALVLAVLWRVRGPSFRLAAGLLLLWAAGLGLTRLEGSEGFPAVEVADLDRPHLVMILLDTTRRDRLGIYGASRETSPRLDRFAEDAVVYDNALSPAPWTLPSHASLFTGLPASAHGCSGARQILNPGWTTLAEHLHEAGYQTVGISANQFVSPSRFFDQGFERFTNPAPGGPRLPPLVEMLPFRRGQDPGESSQAAAVRRGLASWLRQDFDRDRPLFLFLNYMEPHAPYAPPVDTTRWTSETVRSAWAGRNQFDLMNRYIFSRGTGLSDDEIGELSDLYDEEIAFLDGELGKVLDFLEESGLMENAVVAVTSDHGEHFGEHRMMDHLYTLYEPLVRVPLIVRYPDRPVARIPELVQSHDLFATFLEAAGVAWEPTEAHNSRSLRTPRSDRVAVSELEVPFLSNVASWCARMPQVDYAEFLSSIWSVQRGPFKLVGRSGGERELFDLRRPSPEAANLIDEYPLEARELEAVYFRMRKVFRSATWPETPFLTTEPIGDDELERLRSLGYLN